MIELKIVGLYIEIQTMYMQVYITQKLESLQQVWCYVTYLACEVILYNIVSRNCMYICHDLNRDLYNIILYTSVIVQYNMIQPLPLPCSTLLTSSPPSPARLMIFSHFTVDMNAIKFRGLYYIASALLEIYQIDTQTATNTLYN